MSQGKFGGGNGTANKPYLIEDVADLNAIRFYPTKCFKLTQSINLGVYPYNVNKGWLPILNFAGQLDGDGHKIMNLYINRPTQDNVGLFGTAYNQTSIVLSVKNLYIDNCDILGRNHVGAVYGYVQVNETTTGQTDAYIDTCKVTGKIKGSNQVGGVIGQINWTTALNFALVAIRDSYIKTDLSIQVKGTNYGGLVGSGLTFKQNANFDHVIAQCSFDRHVNSVDTDLNPNFAESYFVMTNCFYDKETWIYGTTANGSTVENISNRQKVTDFDKRLDADGNMIWNFAKGKRLPELSLFLRKKHLFKFDNKYYIYEFETEKWTKVADSLKTREKAFEIAMEGIENIDFQGWEKLKTLAGNNTVELITLYENSNGSEYTSKKFDMDKDTTHTTNLKRKYDGLETKLFKKTISFSQLNSDGKLEFGDVIAKISKGIVR